MPNYLVTHINPHLDDISAIWLFKKFHPDFSNAKIEFISQTAGGKFLEERGDLVYFGVGRGKYDEHKGDLKDCATSLLWKEIRESDLKPKDEIERLALNELVEWVRMIDLGISPYEFDSFSVPAFIRPMKSNQEDSLEGVKLGAAILDRILEVVKKEQQALIDWHSAIEFKSKFGKSFAIKSHFVNRAFCKKQGGELFLMYDPKYGSVQFFTPVEEIDLEPIYQKIKEIKPEEEWYLHQSHHMVLCGSSAAPDAKPTKLSFEQLMDVAKSV